MYKFNDKQVESINDALNMAIASNKRMQTSKPQFQEIFKSIINDLEGIKHILRNPEKTVK